MKNVDQMLIFDVDGVITNPREKKITEPEVLDQIIQKLEKGEPIALITGRAHKWVTDRVVVKIENKIGNKNLLDNFFISKEFGGAYSLYENGIRKDLINEQINISPEIFAEVKKIVNESYSASMFVDPDKKTMVSIEMNDNFSVEKFKPLQDQLILKIQKIVDKYDATRQLEIHEDTIATNIRNKSSNKKNATKQVLDWVSGKGFEPQKYSVLGDNAGDLEIAREINENGMTVEFIYVGEESIDTAEYTFQIINTQNKFEKGTLEFLKSQSHAEHLNSLI